ncbi:putative membrane protein YczE [Glaciihabitans tibetensis]|uniref:Putative membrane protein YczE n=1 Tax=Glaciihabitans tibetensis TaxID=1266600 RepID=A0A2T0VDA2_9MICO|nr:hypothetical protein [Glaciihabitans tibetensis]PRY68161.1 putative membrane protein YczE [Glaciihabitans tibetensis]
MSSLLIVSRRILQLAVGLFLYGFAIAMMVRAAVGVPPWDVLTQGLSLQTGWPFGVLTNVIGALVLLLWIPLRQKPGVGTVLNVLLIGPSIEVGLAVIPAQHTLALQLPLFAGGLALLALASGLYLGARLGPGPRDGLMTGIHKRWGWPLWAVRSAIEVSVLSVGWLLGGNVGLGTLAFALLIGPMVGVTIPLLRIPEAPARPATRPVGSHAGYMPDSA